MKTLFLTTALVAGLVGSAVSAQSVLERVLTTVNGNTNMTPVNGIFANIADNIAVVGGGTVWTDGDGDTVPYSTIEADYQAYVDSVTSSFVASNVSFVDTNDDLPGGDAWVFNGIPYASEDEAIAAATEAATEVYDNFDTWLADSQYSSTYLDAEHLLNQIDGSITNTLTGVTSTATVGDLVLAVDQVTVDLGDMSTTVLGAVNTGEITLGVNQGVSEAVAGTSSAVANSIAQLGGSIDSSAIVLNVASNATSVLGSVNNAFEGLDGSVGNVATTVLGAVNTGTITSGVNSAVQGIQSGIVGTGATTN
jgi:hypothetical protein